MQDLVLSIWMEEVQRGSEEGGLQGLLGKAGGRDGARGNSHKGNKGGERVWMGKRGGGRGGATCRPPGKTAMGIWW